MNTELIRLSTLQSLDERGIGQLKKLGIQNLGDLLAFQPFRHARLISAAREGLIRKSEVVGYVVDSASRNDLDTIFNSPVTVILSVEQPDISILASMGLATVKELAEYLPFDEAEKLIRNVVGDDDPFAPACVLPKCKKFTRSSKGFVSFFKEVDVSDLGITSANNSTISHLIHFSTNDCKRIQLGYSVSYQQDWIYCGIHLGEPQGSVSLFMGQDTQVSVLDWKRINRATLREASQVAENLSNVLLHQRAVDEVARATAEEHQYGSTSAFGANAATAGSFVAAGAIVGGVGGGISGALTGLVLGNVANAAGAAPALAGAAVGTAVGSIAGAAAGSLIFSGATTMGFVETDAEGGRVIAARSAQNIQQRTIQNSSSIRSFWANIVSQNVEEEEQRIRTDRVTNHNRIHALNALYFEVLNEYRVNIAANDFSVILFLPFKPINFTTAILKNYWWIVRTYLADQDLVLNLDDYFLKLNDATDPVTSLEEIPPIDEIRTSLVEVEVNIDGNAMETLLLTSLGIASAPLGLIPALMTAFYGYQLRENIAVNIVTSSGTVPLIRMQSPNQDPNFVGKYQTINPISINSIQEIEIQNNNAEFSIEALGFSVDVNRLEFEQITSRVDIPGKSALVAHLPDIGSLEKKEVVSQRIGVSSNRTGIVKWGIGARLRAQYEGLNGEIDSLNQQLAAQESIEAKLNSLIGFLNANKYGFTRLILQRTEQEQLACVLESVKLGGVDLTSIAHIDPLGFSGNHVVLRLKDNSSTVQPSATIGIDTSKLFVYYTEFRSGIDRNNRNAHQLAAVLLVEIVNYIRLVENEGNGSKVELEFKARLEELSKILAKIAENDSRDPAYKAAAQAALVQQAIGVINKTVDTVQNPRQTSVTSLDKIRGYFADVKGTLTSRMGQLIRSDDVSLPSPAVFMEPVLSQAKGAELYDMRRNSHYDILAAPGISSADPNVVRSQVSSLTPTVPGSTLDLQDVANYPLPTSIGSALAEAGKLNLDTLINTNAATLNKTLAGLSEVATELAKASAKLTGDAQKEALTAAGDLAKQIGQFVEKTLPDLTKLQSNNAPVPAPANKPQDKAERVREFQRIDDGKGTKEQKKERKQIVNATTPDRHLDYRMSIIFLDEDNKVYPEGQFTLSMDIFETGSSVDFNGGVPLEISSGTYFLPDVLQLEPGRKVTVIISADIAGAVIDGTRTITLPSHTDLQLTAIMLSETHRISATDVKTAVDQAISQSSFGIGINPMFSSFLNAGMKFPFKIYKIAAAGTADAGAKSELNLKFEYDNSSSSTSTNTTGTTITTEYDVVLPKNGWKIEAN